MSTRDDMKFAGSMILSGREWTPAFRRAAERHWPSVWDEPRFERRVDGALLADHSYHGGAVLVIMPNVPVRVVKGKRA